MDIVVLDPPWGNKHVKRVKTLSGYSKMADSSLLSMPLASIVRPGGLVLCWCTNSPRSSTVLERKNIKHWMRKLTHTQRVLCVIFSACIKIPPFKRSANKK